MTNDDPHDRTRAVAAEEQPAGEQTPARAELLGSTALTARVRCPCGKRQDVDREDWQWNGVAPAPDAAEAYSTTPSTSWAEGWPSP
jgi:hypothetical protein